MLQQTTAEFDPALTEAVRRLYVRPVDEDRARRDVATIAEAARLADSSRGPAVSAGAASRPRRRRMPLWRPALAAAAALVAVPGGMAAAGVQVPEAFEAPYDLVGITLPNQGDDAPTRPAPRRSPAVRTQTPPTTTPAGTTPAGTTPPSSSTATTPAPSTGERRGEERSQRAKRRRAARRAQRATPAVPATPAKPAQPGGDGTRATPATPAQPATPAPRTSTTPQKRSAITPDRVRRKAEQGVPRRGVPSRGRGGGNRSDAGDVTVP